MLLRLIVFMVFFPVLLLVCLLMRWPINRKGLANWIISGTANSPEEIEQRKRAVMRRVNKRRQEMMQKAEETRQKLQEEADKHKDAPPGIIIS